MSTTIQDNKIGDRIAMIACMMIMLGLVIAGCTGCKTVDWITDTYNDISHHDSDDAHSSNPPDESGGFSFSEIKWMGQSFANAKLVNIGLTIREVDSKHIVYGYDDLPSDKFPTKVVEKPVQGIACFFDKNLNGGKFEWLQKSNPNRSFHNIHEGYIPNFTMPKSGDTVYGCIVSTDGTWHSEVAKGVMK